MGRIHEISTRVLNPKTEAIGYTPVPERPSADGIEILSKEAATAFLMQSTAKNGTQPEQARENLLRFLDNHLQAVISMGEGKPHLALVGHEYHGFDGDIPEPLKQLIRSSAGVGVEYIPEEIFTNFQKFIHPAVAKTIFRAEQRVDTFRKTIHGTRAEAEEVDRRKGKRTYDEGIYPYVRYGWFQKIIDEAKANGLPYFSADIANSPKYMVHRAATGILSAGFFGDMNVYEPGSMADSWYSRATGREFGIREMDMEQVRRIMYAISFDKVTDHFKNTQQTGPETQEQPFLLVTWPIQHIAGMLEYYKQIKGINPDLPYPLQPLIAVNRLLHRGLDFNLRVYDNDDQLTARIPLADDLPKQFLKPEIYKELTKVVPAALACEWRNPLPKNNLSKRR